MAKKLLSRQQNTAKRNFSNFSQTMSYLQDPFCKHFLRNGSNDNPFVSQIPKIYQHSCAGVVRSKCEGNNSAQHNNNSKQQLAMRDGENQMNQTEPDDNQATKTNNKKKKTLVL